MTGTLAYSTDGGTASAITYPLEEKPRPSDDTEDVEDAIEFAIEALEAAEKLENMALDQVSDDPLSSRLLNVAVENYIHQFDIPAAALEDYDLVTTEATPKTNKETGKLKKVILYLYAVVERVFKAVFDLFREHYVTARNLIPKTRVFIGESDSLSASIAAQVNIRERSLMTALHIDGIAPRKIPELFDEVASTFEKQHGFAAYSEITKLVQATRNKDQNEISQAAQALRDKLEEGLQASLEEVDPQSIPVFNEKKSTTVTHYASKPSFGQTYILGSIAKEINASGTFHFSCSIRRDADVAVRVNSFPVLTPEDIRHICRITLRICENVIRNSRDESLLHKALREASFLRTKEADKASVVALRNLAAAGQNSYIVHLRHTMKITRSLMRWCAISIARYEEYKRNGQP